MSINAIKTEELLLKLRMLETKATNQLLWHDLFSLE